jgi:putative lipoprotein
MAVWLADDYLVLSQVRAAKGIRYEEGDTVFTLQDDDVVLTVDGERYPDCVLAPSRAPWEDARRRGVSFRAVGNEPGWYLEIQPGRQILYVGEYGMNRVLVPNPGPEETATGQRYHVITENNDLLLDVETSACTDTMKGDSFPATVLLTVNNKRLRGCGRPLDYPWR